MAQIALRAVMGAALFGTPIAMMLSPVCPHTAMAFFGSLTLGTAIGACASAGLEMIEGGGREAE